MGRLIRKRERGFTLIEILIVLAVLAILAAVVVPNVYGFVTQGKDRAWKADQRMLQAAVDAYRTDITTRTGNPWPTVGGGDIGDLVDSGTDGVDIGTDSTVIKVSDLVTYNYIQETTSVKSFAYSTSTGTGATNDPKGSYVWYIDSSGRVKAKRWVDGNTNGIVELTDTLTANFVSGVYP